MFPSEPCNSCYYAYYMHISSPYSEGITMEVICEYFLRTGQLRGCPGGQGCDKFVKTEDTDWRLHAKRIAKKHEERAKKKKGKKNERNNA